MPSFRGRDRWQPFLLCGHREPLVEADESRRRSKLVTEQERRSQLRRVRGSQRMAREQRNSPGPHRKHVSHLVPSLRESSETIEDRRRSARVTGRRGPGAAALTISTLVHAQVTTAGSSRNQPRTSSVRGSAAMSGTRAEASQYLTADPPALPPAPLSCSPAGSVAAGPRSRGSAHCRPARSRRQPDGCADPRRIRRRHGRPQPVVRPADLGRRLDLTASPDRAQIPRADVP